jgi:hypothetical protein
VVVDKVLDASVLEQRYLSGTQKMILLWQNVSHAILWITDDQRMRKSPNVM